MTIRGNGSFLWCYKRQWPLLSVNMGLQIFTEGYTVPRDDNDDPHDKQSAKAYRRYV